MRYDKRLQQAAERIRMRMRHAPDSDERMVADAILAAFATPRRRTELDHNRIYTFYQMLRADGTMSDADIHRTIGQRYNRSASTIRKIIWRLQNHQDTNISVLPHHQIARDEPVAKSG